MIVVVSAVDLWPLRGRRLVATNADVATHTFAGQFIGLYTALQKGLDPDRPRNLSRVVILKDEKKPPENASI